MSRSKAFKEAVRAQHELEHSNEQTLFKVFSSLRRAGLTDKQAAEAIDWMQNDGILFRERID